MTMIYNAYIGYRDLKSDRNYDSGVGFGEENLHKTIEELSYYIQYYKNLGYRITEIQLDHICKNCNGNGMIFIPLKRNKFLGHNKPCPECKGKNSLINILSTNNSTGEFSKVL